MKISVLVITVLSVLSSSALAKDIIYNCSFSRIVLVSMTSEGKYIKKRSSGVNTPWTMEIKYDTNKNKILHSKTLTNDIYFGHLNDSDCNFDSFELDCKYGKGAIKNYLSIRGTSLKAKALSWDNRDRYNLLNGRCKTVK